MIFIKVKPKEWFEKNCTFDEHGSAIWYRVNNYREALTDLIIHYYGRYICLRGTGQVKRLVINGEQTNYVYRKWIKDDNFPELSLEEMKEQYPEELI